MADYPLLKNLIPNPRRKVFVSYHHAQDQRYADEFRAFYGINNTIIDKSLRKEIDSDNNDYILGQIRTNHLKDSTVTVVLIGKHTWARKWVDWEIYSSLRPYESRTINGLLGIILPEATKIPPRFEANYKEANGYQTGYAIVLNWNEIAPPKLWNIMPNAPLLKPVIESKRAKLNDYIEYAYNNRPKVHLIDNTLQRYKNNKPLPFSIW